MTDYDWEKKFYRYYNRHSFPIKYLPQIELLLRDYVENDPKGLKRLVSFLVRTEQMTKSEKWGRFVNTPHNITRQALELLIAYCYVFPEPLPCLLVAFLTRTEVGDALEMFKSQNEDRKEVQSLMDKDTKFLLYALIDPDEKDSEYLKKKLQITDKALTQYALSLRNTLEKTLEKRRKRKSKRFYEAFLVKEPEQLLLEIKILTFLCRNSPISVERILRRYEVSEEWLTQRIDEWESDNYVQVKFDPFTLVRKRALKEELQSLLKPILADTYRITHTQNIVELSDEVIQILDEIDEIVRKEGI